jgi:hypothetical protein
MPLSRETTTPPRGISQRCCRFDALRFAATGPLKKLSPALLLHRASTSVDRCRGIPAVPRSGTASGGNLRSDAKSRRNQHTREGRRGLLMPCDWLASRLAANVGTKHGGLRKNRVGAPASLVPCGARMYARRAVSVVKVQSPWSVSASGEWFSLLCDYLIIAISR